MCLSISLLKGMAGQVVAKDLFFLRQENLVKNISPQPVFGLEIFVLGDKVLFLP